MPKVSDTEKNVSEGGLVLHGTEIDYSDNEEQLEMIKHHYQHEFGTVQPSMADVAKSFCPDAVLHQVIDKEPASYNGKTGVAEKHEALNRFLASKDKFEIQHVTVKQDHAKVEWMADTLQHGKVLGTDTFTFDKKTQPSLIVQQTTMVKSEQAS